MATEHDRCFLYEPSGHLLGAGYCAGTIAEPDAGTVLMVVLDQPGRLVARSLVGPVRDIRLHHSDGTLVPARIARLYFDPRRGRICELLLDSPLPAQPLLAAR
jgi:hypothetical protein